MTRKNSRRPRRRKALDRCNPVDNHYIITNEPVIDKRDNLTPEMLDILERIYHEIPKKPKQVIAELEVLLAKHPDTPKLYNFQVAAYNVLGQHDKVHELAEEVYRRFPDYLFAKINYAQLLLDRGQFKAIPDVFGHKFDLKLLYPDRSVFHVTEFTGFTAILCIYYCYAGQKDLAKMLYGNMLEVAPDSPMIAYARSFLKLGLRMRLKLWLAKKAGSVDNNVPPPPTSPYRVKA